MLTHIFFSQDSKTISCNAATGVPAPKTNGPNFSFGCGIEILNYLRIFIVTIIVSTMTEDNLNAKHLYYLYASLQPNV